MRWLAVVLLVGCGVGPLIGRPTNTNPQWPIRKARLDPITNECRADSDRLPMKARLAATARSTAHLTITSPLTASDFQLEFERRDVVAAYADCVPWRCGAIEGCARSSRSFFGAGVVETAIAYVPVASGDALKFCTFGGEEWIVRGLDAIEATVAARADPRACDDRP